MVDYQIVHERLVAIRDAITQCEPPAWFSPFHGLCFNYSRCPLHRDIDQGSPEPELGEVCGEMWAEWPLFSGDAAFPVPADLTGVWGVEAYAERRAKLAYVENLYNQSLFDGTEYGKCRVSLLDYLIERTNERVLVNIS